MANFVSGVSITLVKRLTSVRRHPADRGFAANNRKKTLAPRVGSGLRQIELNGTVLWERTIIIIIMIIIIYTYIAPFS